MLTCAHSVFHHYERIGEPAAGTWEEEIDRFYGIANKLDEAIAAGLPDRERIAEKLLQGPLSDAMTHVGQLAMLRRMANDPIPSESFFHAPIRVRDGNGS